MFMLTFFSDLSFSKQQPCKVLSIIYASPQRRLPLLL